MNLKSWLSKEREREVNDVENTYHATVGFGSPTQRHSKDIFAPSSDCRITGRSVNVGLMPSFGTGASSPIFVNTMNMIMDVK